MKRYGNQAMLTAISNAYLTKKLIERECYSVSVSEPRFELVAERVGEISARLVDRSEVNLMIYVSHLN